MKLVSGSSNLPLSRGIAKQLGITLAEVELTTFANGEKRVWVKDSVKGENVILVQSFSQPTDEHIMEFLLLADALERLGARHMNVVIPWLGYSLQDKVFREGEPIAAKVVADLVSNSHVKRVFLLDLHNSSTTGFFSVPAHHLTTKELFANHVKKNLNLKKCVVASPDFGGLKRARVFAELLGLDLVNIDKHRNLKTGEIKAMGIKGEVKGKVVIVLDDVINSGSTVITAAEFLKSHGAKEVHFLATHGPLVEGGFTKLQASAVDSVVVTNSILAAEAPSKFKVLDVAPLFAQELKTWAKPAV